MEVEVGTYAGEWQRQHTSMMHRTGSVQAVNCDGMEMFLEPNRIGGPAPPTWRNDDFEWRICERRTAKQIEWKWPREWSYVERQDLGSDVLEPVHDAAFWSIASGYRSTVQPVRGLSKHSWKCSYSQRSQWASELCQFRTCRRPFEAMLIQSAWDRCVCWVTRFLSPWGDDENFVRLQIVLCITRGFVNDRRRPVMRLRLSSDTEIRHVPFPIAFPPRPVPKISAGEDYNYNAL